MRQRKFENGENFWFGHVGGTRPKREAKEGIKKGEGKLGNGEGKLGGGLDYEGPMTDYDPKAAYNFETVNNT